MNRMYLSVDVEEWFNILDVPGAIPFSQWEKCENRLERNLDRLLTLFEANHIRCTMFWLGFFAQKYPELVRRCQACGHEIASHGYAHLLVNKNTREVVRDDIRHSKLVLEDILQAPVRGFRAPGFSVTHGSDWFFDEVCEAGFVYDASVFPAVCSHGGVMDAPLVLHQVKTASGTLWEVPQSVMNIGKRRVCVFGGGYFRLAPLWLIRKGIAQLQKEKRPLITYIHPREIDPEHPRLQMSWYRHFKSYVNLKSTYSKLEWLCRNFDSDTFSHLIEEQKA